MHQAYIDADIAVDLEKIVNSIKEAGGRLSSSRLQSMKVIDFMRLAYVNGVRLNPTFDISKAIDSKIGYNNDTDEQGQEVSGD